MASDRSSSRNRHSPHSIPLQDLPRPPGPDAQDDSTRGHRPNRSSRTRSLLGNRRSFTAGIGAAGRYQRVSDGSPPRQARDEAGLPHVTTPRHTHQGYNQYDDGEGSPVDPSDFQAASVGLSFDHLPLSGAPQPSFQPGGRGSTLGVINESENGPPLTNPFAQPYSARIARAETQETMFSPTDNDTTPLTDTRYLQPIAGARAGDSTSQRHSRSGSRLGDDLQGLESGRYRPNSMASSRSLSVSGVPSPLTRAGTMMRKVSQRVVNVSNEPEILESTLRRQPSTRHARLEAPPSFPALVEDNDQEDSPIEKRPPLLTVGTFSKDWRRHPNPLRGRSLGLFSPDNWIRRTLCEILVHPVTEPTILVLIIIHTILLAVDSAPHMEYGKRPKRWPSSWIDYALLVLFLIYSLELLAKIIVSGLIKNAEEYSTLDWDLGFKRAIIDKTLNMFVPHRTQSTTKQIVSDPAGPQPSILKSFTGMQMPSDQPGHSRQQQRMRLARRAFLRHSFNRLDLVAVISFWISFALSLALGERTQHVYVFRMLSCLRILRLLGLTTGTSVILRSLKRATPLLINVAFLISFFWLLFAIIGVQCFKSSFRRSCVWFEEIDNIREIHLLDSNFGNMEFYYQNTAPNSFQPCGGYINSSTGEPWPWVHADANLTVGTENHKGYLCPAGSLCLENSNPYAGTVSFDNVLQSLQLVFVIMSSNTFSDLLYYTTDSDFLPAAIFFALGIVIMSLWLMNLLVAVITSSFQVIREESKTSAFTVEGEPIQAPVENEKPRVISTLKKAYDRTRWLWVILIVLDLVVQSLRSASMGPGREKLIQDVETIVTIILLIEIALRFASDWRNFHQSKYNWVDLGLAVITAVIQIPPIRNSGQPYAWLTFFQILRIYRVVLAVSLTRDLIVSSSVYLRTAVLISSNYR